MGRLATARKVFPSQPRGAAWLLPNTSGKKDGTQIVLRGVLPVPRSRRQERHGPLAFLRLCRWPSRRTAGSGASARCPHPPCCHLQPGGWDICSDPSTGSGYCASREAEAGPTAYLPDPLTARAKRRPPAPTITTLPQGSTAGFWRERKKQAWGWAGRWPPHLGRVA